MEHIENIRGDRLDEHYDVIIAGAGPVGLTLAIALGRRGVKTLICEREATPAPWPKMDRTNARSMEIFRRLGLVDRIRALGYPADNPMNVYLVTRLSEPAVAVLPFPSVGERRAQIEALEDGSLGLEPYQLVSQNKVEPLLKEEAEATPNVTVRYGHEVTRCEQDGDSVTATLQASGRELIVRGSYLAGCDGGASTIRRSIGGTLEGQGNVRELRQVIFGSEDLYERISAGKGRHYNFIDGSVLVAQGDRKEFTLHTSLPESANFTEALRSLIGFDCDLDVRHVLTWRMHLLLADRYRVGRVFLAGDAAHLVIPTGGLGMNTGVGDAMDLSWKLAGTIQGWGGAGLLDSYACERRPVGQRNIEASGWAAMSVNEWQQLVTPGFEDDTAAARAERQQVAEAFRTFHSRMHTMVGAEMAYTYAESRLVHSELGNEPGWSITEYAPHARAGARLPHAWLSDGSALHDRLGDGYTFVDLTNGEGTDTSELERAFVGIGAPLEILCLDEPSIRARWQRDFLLVRPDLHISWSGTSAPPANLAARSTGNA